MKCKYCLQFWKPLWREKLTETEIISRQYLQISEHCLNCKVTFDQNYCPLMTILIKISCALYPGQTCVRCLSTKKNIGIRCIFWLFSLILIWIRIVKIWNGKGHANDEMFLNIVRNFGINLYSKVNRCLSACVWINYK